MVRKFLLGVFVTLLLAGALGYTKYTQIVAAIAEAMARQMPPDAVTSATVVEQYWVREVKVVGSLAPIQGALLASEDGGRVASTKFTPGDVVKAGAVLVRLDTAVEQAQLQSTRAELTAATLERNRQRDLKAQKATSQNLVESSEAAYRKLEAEVLRLEALIDRKTITAPFAGKLGVRLVSEGDVIQAGVPVVSLQALESLFVNFSLPQRVLGSVGVGATVHFSVDTYPGEDFIAHIQSIDPQVDEKTRMAKVQAVYQNKDERLRPGMYVTLRAELAGGEQVKAIPISSVSFAPYGDTVFVIKPIDGAKAASEEAPRPIETRVITLGERRGDMISVTSGLSAGEEVVSSGTFKLRPDSLVIINNAVSPDASEAPTPPDT